MKHVHTYSNKKTMNTGKDNFSWSSFDFNSSFKFYSSDEDNNNIIDPDTYIEFELDSSIHKDFEFCVTVPKFVSFPSSHSPAIDEVVGSTSRNSTGNCSNLLFRLIRNVKPQRSFSKPKTVVEEGDRRGSDDAYRINSYSNWELVRSRKASTTNNKISMGSSGIMNLMRSILLSLHQTPISNNNHSPSSWKIANWTKPIDNLFTKWRKYDIKRTMVKRSNRYGEKFKSKGLLEDLKLTGVLTKLFVKTGGSNARVVGRIALSCTTSTIDSSLIHQSGDATASSVRAAIAHCKKSLGQSDDFCY